MTNEDTEPSGNRAKPIRWLHVPPEGEPLRREAISFNTAALYYAEEMSKADLSAARRRMALTITLIVMLMAAGFALVSLALSKADAEPAALAALGGIIAVLVIALFVGPLQMYERDSVYRRWSDLLAVSFYLQVGDGKADLAAIRRATTSISASYNLLAAAHGKVANSSTDAIVALITAESKESAGGDADEKEPTTITVETPTDPKSTTGKKIDDLKLTVTAPKDTTYAETDLPKGITFDREALTFAGTPTEDGAFKPSIVATSESAGQELKVSFAWTVKGSTPA